MGWMSGHHGPAKMLDDKLVRLDASLWLWARRLDDPTAPEIGPAGRRAGTTIDELLADLSTLRDTLATQIEEFDAMAAEREEWRQRTMPHRLRSVS